MQVFIKTNYSITWDLQPYSLILEEQGFLRLGRKTSPVFRQHCCSKTKLSSGLEARVSARVHPADTKLLDAMKVIKNKNTLDIKQEV